MIARPSRAKQLLKIYKKYGCTVLSSIRAEKNQDYDRYGFGEGKFIEEGVMQLETIVEKPGKKNALSDLAHVSGFIFTPDIFNYLDEVLENLEPGREFYYNDALKLMLKHGKRILAAEIKGGKYYDTGNKLEYMKTVVEFGLKHPDINDAFREYLKSLSL